MKILVFGATGQVATELTRRVAASTVLEQLPRETADLANPEACARHIDETDASVVINAAAYTAVDQAEDEEDLATRINGDAPAAMARAAADRGLPFLHVSTDYVFDGSGAAPWRPSDMARPQGAYGRSKLKGEAGIAEAGGSAAILRTSWVFSSHGANFVKSMLRLGDARERLTIVADQIGGPTPAGAIADALLSMAATMSGGAGARGVYHFAGAPNVSWADFARAIFDRTGQEVVVEDIPSSQYPTKATRPGNSRLDCTHLTTDFGIERPDWRVALDEVLTDLGRRA